MGKLSLNLVAPDIQRAVPLDAQCWSAGAGRDGPRGVDFSQQVCV